MRKFGSLVLVLAIIGVLYPQSLGTARAVESCGRASVGNLVRSFVRAYNRGDTQMLESIWAPEPDFEWYSVSPEERVRDDAYDRQTLVPYFEKRHILQDRLRLKYLHVRRDDGRGVFGISYRLHRQSNQREGRGRYHGKASAREITSLPSVDNPSFSRCVLFVWSMGRE